MNQIDRAKVNKLKSKLKADKINQEYVQRLKKTNRNRQIAAYNYMNNGTFMVDWNTKLCYEYKDLDSFEYYDTLSLIAIEELMEEDK